ncbi:hypothetical protein LCGC14_0195030 [marine sediment metagenome]|uniref:Metallopeptidase domain-containing protein n=1 Tax=marine sediment metagenome TaxID=412755 RepID=A0A0F9UK87_9ZZZZ
MYTDKVTLDEFYNQPELFERDESENGALATKTINEAKTSLFLDNPFFGFILGQYKVTPTTNSRIRQFGADYKRLYVNTDYILNLLKEKNTYGKIKGALLHMLMHIIHRHNERQADREKTTWKEACDISAFLVMDHSKTLQSRYDENINWEVPDVSNIPDDYRNIPAGEIYNKLIKDRPPNQPPGGGGQLPMGIQSLVCDLDAIQDEMEIQGISAESRALEDQRQEGILRNAYNSYKDRGDIPQGILSEINEMLEPKVSWKLILQQFVQSQMPNDYTWSRPNRRMYAHGVYMPAMKKENLNAMIAVDTSGSIGQKELMAFLTEINSILQSITNTRIILVDIDARINEVRIIEPGEDFRNHKFKGGGGTNFIPLFEEEFLHEHSPDVILYFTDGYGRFPDNAPSIPTIWLMTTDVEAPFGTTVEYDLTEEN